MEKPGTNSSYSRDYFLDWCKRMAIGSAASRALGLLPVDPLMSLQEKNSVTVQNGFPAIGIKPTWITDTDALETTVNSKPEGIRIPTIHFIDRQIRAFVYDYYGMSSDHSAYFVDPDNLIMFPRNRAIFLGSGIDFSGFDGKFKEWEKWVIATNPTTSAEKIEADLSLVHSPLAGKGKFIYDLGVAYGVDPNFFMAICFLESRYATVKSVALSSYNSGSLRRSPLAVGTKNGFAMFNSWDTGIVAWYELIANKYFMEWTGLTHLAL